MYATTQEKIILYDYRLLTGNMLLNIDLYKKKLGHIAKRVGHMSQCASQE